MEQAASNKAIYPFCGKKKSVFMESFIQGPVHTYTSRYLLCRWEDNLNNGTGGRSVQRAGMNVSASNSSRSSSRGRGGRGGGAHAASTTFVSATGDPISGRRCFVCGDPSHFANACPNRGS